MNFPWKTMTLIVLVTIVVGVVLGEWWVVLLPPLAFGVGAIFGYSRARDQDRRVE